VRKVTENAGEWADRSREMYGKTKEAVVKGVDEAEKYVRDATSTVKETAASAIPAGVSGSRPSSGSSYGSGSAFGGGSESMHGSSSDQVRGHQSGSGSSSTESYPSPSSSGSHTGPSLSPGSRRS
jgi:hypothetical protein